MGSLKANQIFWFLKKILQNSSLHFREGHSSALDYFSGVLNKIKILTEIEKYCQHEGLTATTKFQDIQFSYEGVMKFIDYWMKYGFGLYVSYEEADSTDAARGDNANSGLNHSSGAQHSVSSKKPPGHGSPSPNRYKTSPASKNSLVNELLQSQLNKYKLLVGKT